MKVHSNINWSTITIEKDGENDRYRIKYDSDSLIDMNSRPGPNHNTYYMSPEQVFDQNLTEKSDIWSLAVTAIEFYLGQNHMGRQHFLPNTYPKSGSLFYPRTAPDRTKLSPLAWIGKRKVPPLLPPFAFSRPSSGESRIICP